MLEIPNIRKDSNLRTFTDSVKKHLRSLRNLGDPVDQWDTLSFSIFTKKLDLFTQKEWESLFISKNVHNERVVFTDFITFLEKRCLLLESVYSERPDSKSATKFEHKAVNKFNSFQKRPFSEYALNSNLVNCHFCKGNHKLYACEKLKELPVASRIQEIKNLKLCTNCLRDNHKTAQCYAQGCKICHHQHNTILHSEQTRNNNSSPHTFAAPRATNTSEHSTNNVVTSTNHNHNNPNHNQSLISTTKYHSNICNNSVSQLINCKSVDSGLHRYMA